MRNAQPPYPRPGADSGFTLLELLIAVSLLGLLAVLMTGGLRFGAQVWNSGGAAAERSTQSIVAQRFVRRQIAEILPLTDPQAEDRNNRRTNRGRELLFFGERDALRMITGRLANAYQGGPFLVELRLAGEAGAKNLVVSWRELAPDLGDLSDRKPMSDSTLVEKVREIKFGYFGPRDDGDADAPSEWQDRWANRSDLPLLVRLRVDTADDDGQRWPELVAAPRIRTAGLR